MSKFENLSSRKRVGLYLRTNGKQENLLADVYEVEYKYKNSINKVYIVAGYKNILIKSDDSISYDKAAVYGKSIWKMDVAVTVINIKGYNRLNEVIEDLHSSSEEGLLYSELKF